MADEMIDVTVEGEVLEKIKAIAMVALSAAGTWEAAVTYCEAAKQMCEQLRDGTL